MTDTALDALTVLRDAKHELIAVEVRRFTALCDYADACSWSDRADGSDLVAFGHDGTPLVQQYADLELGAALGIDSKLAALELGIALDVRHRLPYAWKAVTQLQLRP